MQSKNTKEQNKGSTQKNNTKDQYKEEHKT